MWRVIFLIVSLNMLVACTKTEDYLRDMVIKHSDLVDPSSAMFRNVTFGGIGINTWCGEINVKNRMGGYTGWKLFDLNGSSFSLLQLKDESDESYSEIHKRMNKLRIEMYEFSCKGGKPTSEWSPFWRTW
jgi:hypothetical protein